MSTVFKTAAEAKISTENGKGKDSEGNPVVVQWEVFRVYARRDIKAGEEVFLRQARSNSGVAQQQGADALGISVERLSGGKSAREQALAEKEEELAKQAAAIKVRMAEMQRIMEQALAGKGRMDPAVLQALKNLQV